jgi:hypothetical protein
MKFWIVMEDLGDGDVALTYFKEKTAAEEYMKQNEDWCYYESNPRFVDTDTIQFKDGI